MPPIDTTAIGERISPPCPCPSAIGIMETMIATFVISTGRSFTAHACTMMSRQFSPLRRNSWM